MNPIAASVHDPTAPPPIPPQPPRSSFSCDRHPDEQFSGFCPSCLCERLTVLDKSSSNTPSSSRRPSSASATAAAIKSLFSSSSSKPTTSNNFFPPPPPSKPSKPVPFLPELRRTKSFSASKNDALSCLFEPQRKSCDVRARNTLWSLFTLNDDDKIAGGEKPYLPSSQNFQSAEHCDSFLANKPISPEPENEEYLEDSDYIQADFEDHIAEEADEIVPVPVPVSRSGNLKNNTEREIAEPAGSYVLDMNNLKRMDERPDLGNREKKSSGGGFWAAAPFFSKKWHDWRRKQKNKRRNNEENTTALPVEKPISRQFMETQSEVADYEFARRSCDTGPRFSLDVGRMSFDDPRYSFDEPRASWDGHLIGKSSRRIPPMVSLIEDSPEVLVSRPDMHIPVEELAAPPPPAMNCSKGEDVLPGGSIQTREYYADSSSKRRKSLDRSSSMRKTEALPIDTNVLPSTADYLHGAKVIEGERDHSKDSNPHTFKDEYADTFELKNGYRDRIFPSNGMIGNGEEVKEAKKSRRWSWRLWDLIQWRGGRTKYEDDARFSRANGVERCLSESWQDLNRAGSGNVRSGLNGKMFRSNSSASWRNSNQFVGSFGILRKNSEMNGNGIKKNRSARYSPNHFETRCYVASMSDRKGGMSFNPNNSHSIARSVLRLY